MLYFTGSLAIKYVSVNNQQCMISSMLIDLNLDELHYYPFIISMNRCDKGSNFVEDPFAKTCVPNKRENLNLNVHKMIKGING